MKSEGLFRNLNLLLRGAVIEFAPGLIKGAMVQMLSDVTVNQAILWVTQDYVLLNRIPEKYRREMETFNLGDMKWLNANWVIIALKDQKPELASLFLSWRKGHNWLERQCKSIKEEFTSGKNTE